MYKLMIVDDEQIVLDSVKFIVEKDIDSMLVTESAQSGREAIEKAAAFRPDIVIMDIRMPGISGLDAINAIKDFHGGALFIIITAYEKFDFAKEAINLGVIDYITKPLSRAAVAAAVKNAIAIKDAERKKLDLELELKEKMAYILPALESGFIYSMLFSDDHADELNSYGTLLGLGSGGGYVMTIEFGDTDEKEGLTNKIGSGIRIKRFYPVLRDIIKENCNGVVGPVMLNRVIAFVPCGLNEDEYAQRIEALDIASRIHNKLKFLNNIVVYIGIGKCYRELRSLYKSYEESLKAIGYAANSAVVHINDIPIELSAAGTFPDAEEKLLFKQLTAGEEEACLKSFEKIFEWVADEYGGDPHQAVTSLTELVVMLGRIHRDYCGDAQNLNAIDQIDGFLSIEDISALKTFLRDRIRLICDEINCVRETKLSGVITSAQDYIHRNYSKDITLESVSKEVNVSPNYFSRLFKDETGNNFIDYLTMLRMEKAKELLLDSNYYNKEICSQIGYSDPNYFSRIFKRIVGMTPTEYKVSMTGK